MRMEIRSLGQPDVVREFEKGSFELLTVGGVTIGRARYEPGWRWSEHVGARTGERSCGVRHLVLVLSGRAAVALDGGPEFEIGPGDLCAIPPGHDSWVVGDEPYVSLHFLGAGEYATPARSD